MENEENIVKTQKELENTKKEQKKLKKTVIILIIIIIILLGIVTSVYLVRTRLVFYGQAKTSITSNVELKNSYMFASPLRARGNGNEKIRVTVFVLDSNGRGVLGKTVNMVNKDSLDFDMIQAVTDDMGRAIFDISTLKKGLFVIEATVDGKLIPQKININFE